MKSQFNTVESIKIKHYVHCKSKTRVREIGDIVHKGKGGIVRKNLASMRYNVKNDFHSCGQR